MKCLCCNQIIDANASEYERQNHWHLKCIHNFFNTNFLPELYINETTLEEIAKSYINQGYTIPGVQKKLSLHLTEEKKPRLTLVDYPTGYILKPQTEKYASLPEAEFLVMSIAKEIGIKVVPFGLIKTKDGLAYITRRIDRIKNKNGYDFLAMEDFCQLDLRLTEDKYKGSYERCAKIIKKYSSYIQFDLSELFLRLLFCFVIGNSDMHLKNFSLIEISPKSFTFSLSSAYDLLPVNAILKEDPDEFALALNGKKSHLTKNDFITYGEHIGLNLKTISNMIQLIISKKDLFLMMCEESYLPSSLKEDLKELIINRIHRLL